MKINRNTEQDIINAARVVFLAKGYKATTVREIVTKAHASKSMLNYYFRSKENLFNIIFDEVFHSIYVRVIRILLDEDLDFFEKIQLVTSDYISFFNDNPQLAIFIAAEVNRSPEKVGKRIRGLIQPNFTNAFDELLKKEYQRGTICQISGYSLLINILSLCTFPVIASPILTNAIGGEKISIESILGTQKTEVANFIINAIKSKNN